MNHPIVARLREHSQRITGNAGARINGSHVGLQQPNSPLRLVHGGNTEALQPGDHGEIRAREITYRDP